MSLGFNEFNEALSEFAENTRQLRQSVGFDITQNDDVTLREINSLSITLSNMSLDIAWRRLAFFSMLSEPDLQAFYEDIKNLNNKVGDFIKHIPCSLQVCPNELEIPLNSDRKLYVARFGIQSGDSEKHFCYFNIKGEKLQQEDINFSTNQEATQIIDSVSSQKGMVPLSLREHLIIEKASQIQHEDKLSEKIVTLNNESRKIITDIGKKYTQVDKLIPGFNFIINFFTAFISLLCIAPKATYSHPGEFWAKKQSWPVACGASSTFQNLYAS